LIIHFSKKTKQKCSPKRSEGTGDKFHKQEHGSFILVKKPNKSVLLSGAEELRSQGTAHEVSGGEYSTAIQFNFYL